LTKPAAKSGRCLIATVSPPRHGFHLSSLSRHHARTSTTFRPLKRSNETRMTSRSSRRHSATMIGKREPSGLGELGEMLCISMGRRLPKPSPKLLKFRDCSAPLGSANKINHLCSSDFCRTEQWTPEWTSAAGEIDRHRWCWRREVHRQAFQPHRPPAPCHPPKLPHARAQPSPAKFSFAELWTVGSHPMQIDVALPVRRCDFPRRRFGRFTASCRGGRCELQPMLQLPLAGRGRASCRSRQSALR